MNPNYRNTDSPTSALAGRETEANGSAREIEDRLCIKAHKRLPELRRAGMVRNGHARTCTVSGRLALTWHPIHHRTNTGDRA